MTGMVMRIFPLLFMAVILPATPDGFAATAGQTAPATVFTLIQGQPSSARKNAPAAIPFAEVATKATEVSAFLAALNSQPTVSPEVRQVQDGFFTLSGRFTLDYALAQRTITEQPTLEKLQAQQQLWQERQTRLKQWLAILTTRTSQLQDDQNSLNTLAKTWSLTRDAALAAKPPLTTIQQIDTTLAAIRSAQSPIETRTGAVMTIQDLVAGAVAKCDTILQGLSAAVATAMGGILVRGAPPLWDDTLWDQARATLAERVRLYLELYLAQFRSLVGNEGRSLTLLGGLMPFLVILFTMVRRRVTAMEAAGETSPAIEVFERPIAGALVLFFMMGSSSLMVIPQAVRVMMEVLALIPMIILIRPALLLPRLVRAFWTLGVLFFLDTVRQGIAGAPLLEQGFLLVEAGSGLLMFRWAVSLSRDIHKDHARTTRNLLRIFTLCGMIALALSLGAVIGGYLRLARLLVSGVLMGGVQAIWLFTIAQIIKGIMALALRSWPVNSLRMVAHHCDLLERRLNLALVWTAMFMWAMRTLDYVGLQTPLARFLTTLLEARLKRGEFSISPGDILACALAVWISFLLSSFLKFILSEDVFPRTTVAPGVSYAVTSLLRYTLIVTGFLFGLGELGLTVNRVVIILGALGVGIGFGLQNVVNNFISGLILLFERPIHVGDAIELDTISGEVRQIGIRASTIRSWQGADLIVPNSQLVSERVTNWTHHDRLKRIEIAVGVNYGADERLVIELLEGVARVHPKILATPPYQCLFKGFGDSTINFELRAWTDQYGEWQQIKSELTAGIYRAVQAAGLSFPFPQRDIHLVRETNPRPNQNPGRKPC